MELRGRVSGGLRRPSRPHRPHVAHGLARLLTRPPGLVVTPQFLDLVHVPLSVVLAVVIHPSHLLSLWCRLGIARNRLAKRRY